MFDITTLQSLVGKTVRLYRGRAETIRGILLATKSNYLVQLTEDSQVLYYYLPPLTSIEEDFRNPPFEIKKGIPQEVIEAESYEQLLKSLVNKRVRINRTGKDSYTGILRFAGTDYVALQTEKGTLVYYQLSEIKCIGIQGKTHGRSQKDGTHSKIRTKSPLYQLHDAPNFSALLDKLRNTFVHVHFTSYEPISGILTEADQNQIALVHNKELVWISKATIASLTTTSSSSSSSSSSSDTVSPANQNARHVGNREVFCLRVKKRDRQKQKYFSTPPAVRIHPKKKPSKHQISLKTPYPFNQRGNSLQSVTIKLPGMSYPKWNR
ncbi:hypothetical protein [Brevibacillus halotolerans]|uniref:hypothetical protein n=1 Tax=Brevibacillus halotolerans TaxID=1507437 RepID=UPI0015EE6D23|nr:hypothetical protein [Brevibacillus halotolerans]MBA4532873.1 hypothetical protein [Brevibacillus halotolerans]